MLIPYNTDAPIYFYPFATIGLIVVNCAAYFLSMQATDVEELRPWMLQFGQGLHPVQWITNNFMHADLLHLAGNMFFLWGFGLVVEGKLGWWKFLLLYMVMGAIYGFLIQLVMLHGHGGALGASGVIFALLMISVIWAPKNEMNCFMWALRPQTITLPITVFATTYLLFQIIAAWLSHFSMSSAILHLSGAAIGTVFGVALLKLKLVDCEDWDIFALLGGRIGKSKAVVEAEKKAKAKPKSAVLPALGSTTTAAPAQKTSALDDIQFLSNAFKNRLAAGDVNGAAKIYREQRPIHPEWTLSETELMQFILALHKNQLWGPALPPMIDYVRQFPQKSVRMRLKLAQILIEHERRPGKALKVLSQITPTTLPTDLQPVYMKLKNLAEEQHSVADLEAVDGEDW